MFRKHDSQCVQKCSLHTTRDFAAEVLKINFLGNQPFTLKSRSSQTEINAYLRHSPIAEPIIIKLYL